MFTIDIVLGLLKKVFGGLLSFLWEYKGWVIIAIVIGVLYIRGNNYRDNYQQESVAHNNTVLQYNQQINDIRLANETALRIAQEESAANYKELVEKTSKIQKEYIDREEDINTNIDKLSASNDSLFKQSKISPNVIPIPVKVQCQIPPMPTVYKSSVDYSKLALQNKTTLQSKLTD